MPKGVRHLLIFTPVFIHRDILINVKISEKVVRIKKVYIFVETFTIEQYFMDVLNKNITGMFHKLHVNEHVKAHEDALEIIKPNAENIPEVKESLNTYEASVERLALIFRHSPESPETKQIAGFDERRDELWIGGQKIIKLYLNSPDPLVRTAADVLRILMNAYGNVPHFSLYGETGSLKHAINNLKKPENQAKVTLVPGFTALISELETVNNELDILYKQRFQESEAVKQLGKLGDHLPVVDKLLINLFRALNTVYNYNEMTAKLPELKATIERIALYTDALFDQLRKVLSRRSPEPDGKQKPDPTDPTGPTDPTDPEEPGEGGEDGGDGGDEGDGGDGYQTPDINNPPAPFE